jgi:hypothetical protein
MDPDGYGIANTIPARPEPPPVGVKPQWLHNEIRFHDLAEAIGRYSNPKHKMPVEWIEELLKLHKEVIK